MSPCVAGKSGLLSHLQVAISASSLTEPAKPLSANCSTTSQPPHTRILNIYRMSLFYFLYPSMLLFSRCSLHHCDVVGVIADVVGPQLVQPAVDAFCNPRCLFCLFTGSPETRDASSASLNAHRYLSSSSLSAALYARSSLRGHHHQRSRSLPTFFPPVMFSFPFPLLLCHRLSLTRIVNCRCLKLLLKKVKKPRRAQRPRKPRYTILQHNSNPAHF